MRDRLRIFGYLAIFWICFQIIIRIIFLAYNISFSERLSAGDLLSTFWYGFKMDLSLAGYLLALSGLMLSISAFTQSQAFRLSFHIVVIIALILSGLIVTIDIELYRHWGFRLNTTPFLYIGSEAIGSVSFAVVLKLLSIFALLFGVSLMIYWKKISGYVNVLRKSDVKTFAVMFALSGLMFLPIRGSFTVAPMNTGFVYFHQTNAFANHAAINVIWNFVNSLRKSANVEYPENFYDGVKAESLFSELYRVDSTATPRLFTTPKPNIILVILESFTADVIEPLGGKEGVAPNLSALCREGVLFDNIYSSGDRTDKGLISILSAYPAQPTTSIIKFPAKTQRLPYLNHYIDSLGYNTSFVYGGDIDFANFRSYLTSCRFGHMTTEDDFSSDVNESKWGVHDNLVLDRAFTECDTARSPFFKVVLTLSSHEPFDVPMKQKFKGNDEESLFLNSCYFTDSTIGDFVRKARTRPWWNNSVIVFVADHGHRHPGNKQARDKERFRIPLLMIGGALSRDTVIHTYGNQTDIANTLLAQLDKPSDDFRFSKNLLHPKSRSFSIYFFNDGYGFVDEDSYIVYDNAGKQFTRRETDSDNDIEISKAYQQILYSDYNKK